MKKVRTEIITILLLIVLIVAGGYYFKPFVSGLPNKKDTGKDTEKAPPAEQLTFQERVKKLDTSQKIVDYLNKYYRFEPRESNQAYSPQQFFNKKSGDTQDFAVFTTHVLYQHDFAPFIIRYRYQDDGDGTNFVTEFSGPDGPKYFYFNSKGVHLVYAGQSFKELIQKEEQRLKVKVKKYGLLGPSSKNLEPEKWYSRQ